jgi:hypothetical protein
MRTSDPRRPAHRRLLLPLLSLLLLSSCGLGGTDPDFARNGFSVHSRDGHLELQNTSQAPVHYVAVEENTSALIDLFYDPELWPNVPPNDDVRIPYGELIGYDSGATHAIVHWWTDGRYGEVIRVELR